MKKAKLDTEHSHTKTSEEGKMTTVPLTVDKFTFHHVLGTGSFGMVMLATDSIQKERVAIKAVKKQVMTWNKEEITEGKILQMTHESIFLVHGYGAFHTETYLYYVMELVTGGTLDVFEERAPLSLCTVQFLVAEIVCGVQFLHSKGIIHRDLKYDNILLTSQGHIKITDFGLSFRITKEGYFNGTPALEKIIGEPYLAADDWFNLGIIINGLVSSPENLERFKTFIELVENRETSEYFTPTIKDLLMGLLCKDKSLRLGIRGNIREHDFFSSINWEEVESGKMTSPLKISTKDATDEYVTTPSVAR
ncbi:unnamed protein product [Ranitomeya imitator]|uniref:Protein kinase domain-containing protein n=1 Tax=Ranitomeya imitator TaxID=111125 RepID=A0ABN9KSP1_9NEOB|nr:unnamed protein product [Ranitomeya imitator]CAJ0927845.1 unnamed protein product [Ranitomeya imitator]